MFILWDRSEVDKSNDSLIGGVITAPMRGHTSVLELEKYMDKYRDCFYP